MDTFEEEETSEGHWDDEELSEVSEVRPVKSELVMLEMLLHLPKDLKKLQKLLGELGIKLKAEMLSKYWKEVVRGRGEFEGVKWGDPENFTDQWYEARKAEIAKIEKECEARSKSFNKPWKEEEDLGQGVKLVMVLIPAGKFVMGSEMGHFENETQHEVTLTKSYYMGKYAVTQEQWKAVMGKNPSDTKGAKLPVTYVSWNDCKNFIKKLNGITKGKYRLPTEAEWEYACRAGTTTAFSFGDEITPKDANYGDSKLGKPIEVGSYKPNTFGLYDMHGNVWEWCEDWYGDYPKGAVIDPKGPAKGEYRVLRGGSFEYRLLCEVKGEYLEDLVRSSIRLDVSPCHKFNSFGFRLARTI